MHTKKKPDKMIEIIKTFCILNLLENMFIILFINLRFIGDLFLINNGKILFYIV